MTSFDNEMFDPDDSLEKIQDPGLQVLAMEGAKEQVSVIVVIDTPELQVNVGEVQQGSRQAMTVKGLAPVSDEDQALIDEVTKEARSFLTEVVGEQPNHLSIANAFVVNVDGKQLQMIAESPLTKSIQPNRAHK